MPGPKEDRNAWIRFSGIGIEFAAAVAGFSLVGYWIDRRYGTDPWGVESPRPLQSALTMGFAFVVGAVVPVIPYLITEGQAALFTSLGLTAGALFLVGAWRAYLTSGIVWRKATEMVVLAAIAVGVAHLIGRLVGVGID